MRTLMVVRGLLACAHPTSTSSPATPTGRLPPMAEPDRPVPADLLAEVEAVARTAEALSEMMANSVSATRGMLALRESSDPEVFAVLTVETPWARAQASVSRNSAAWCAMYESRPTSYSENIGDSRRFTSSMHPKVRPWAMIGEQRMLRVS